MWKSLEIGYREEENKQAWLVLKCTRYYFVGGENKVPVGRAAGYFRDKSHLGICENLEGEFH